jgi:putative membrane protein
MKLQRCGKVFVFAIATLGWAGAAGGADDRPTVKTDEVLMKLHHSNQMEIAAGKLAQEQGQSQDVKRFGKTLVTDHSAADKKVLALAKQEKITLPAAEAMPGEMMDKMKAVSGADFDKTFAAEMLDDHKKDIAEVQSARDGTADAKLKTLLTAMLPVLEKHRDTAQKLTDKLGPSASAAGGTNAAPAPTAE